jgi:hypothetical protein
MPLIRRRTRRRHGGEAKVKKRMMALLGLVAAVAAQSAAPPIIAEPAQAVLPRQAARPLISGPVRTGPLLPCTLVNGAVNGVKPEPCRLTPRRAVPQIVERMPVPPPRGHGALPPPAVPSTLAPPAVPSAPRPLARCVGGACRDAGGVLYNGGVGNATLDPNGRLCNRDGVWLQCF